MYNGTLTGADRVAEDVWRPAVEEDLDCEVVVACVFVLHSLAQPRVPHHHRRVVARILLHKQGAVNSSLASLSHLPCPHPLPH